MHYAAENGSLNVILAMVSRGAGIDPTDEFIRTPLMIAIENNKSAVARSLIELGADLEGEQRVRETPRQQRARQHDRHARSARVVAAAGGAALVAGVSPGAVPRAGAGGADGERQDQGAAGAGSHLRRLGGGPSVRAPQRARAAGRASRWPRALLGPVSLEALGALLLPVWFPAFFLPFSHDINNISEI